MLTTEIKEGAIMSLHLRYWRRSGAMARGTMAPAVAPSSMSLATFVSQPWRLSSFHQSLQRCQVLLRTISFVPQPINVFTPVSKLFFKGLISAPRSVSLITIAFASLSYSFTITSHFGVTYERRQKLQPAAETGPQMQSTPSTNSTKHGLKGVAA